MRSSLHCSPESRKIAKSEVRCVSPILDGEYDAVFEAHPDAVAECPHVTVPMGRIDTVPVGLSFMSGAWREPCLIALAYAFERFASR